jgi:hypothetical protein
MFLNARRISGGPTSVRPVRGTIAVRCLIDRRGEMEMACPLHNSWSASPTNDDALTMSSGLWSSLLIYSGLTDVMFCSKLLHKT